MGEIAPIYLIAPFNLISFPSPPARRRTSDPQSSTLQYLLSLNNILHRRKKDKDNLINPKTYITGFPQSWKILENPGKKWSWKVMEKSWKIAKIQNFMEICLPGKESWKVMEISCPNPSWKVMEFVFEFVWEQCKNIFEMIQFQSKNLIIHTDLYFCTVSCRVPDNKNSQLILVVPSIDRLSNEFHNS